MNIPRRLTTIRQIVTTLVGGVTRHKRTAATRVLVFLIIPEERKRKPYALPVQILRYKSFSDSKARETLQTKLFEK